MTPNEAMRTADEMHCGHTACVQLLIDSGRRDCVESSMVRAQRSVLAHSLLQTQGRLARIEKESNEAHRQLAECDAALRAIGLNEASVLKGIQVLLATLADTERCRAEWEELARKRGPAAADAAPLPAEVPAQPIAEEVDLA
jgi:hypothetical protein